MEEGTGITCGSYNPDQALDVTHSTCETWESTWESTSTYSDTPHYRVCCCDCDPLQLGEHRVIFRPGQDLGLLGDWGSGIITDVEEGGQAERLGVKRGWLMKGIGEVRSELTEFDEYSEQLLNENLKNRDVPFEVVFQDLRENRTLNHGGRDCCLCLCFCKGPIFQRCFHIESLHAAMHSTKTPRFLSGVIDRDRLCCSNGMMMSMCGCGAVGQTYSAIALDGEDLPQSAMYNLLPAAMSSLSFRSTMKNVCLFPVHFHRSCALNNLTTLNMVSDKEKELLMTKGHLRHPTMQLPGVAPILNYIVWRRSSLIVLMTFVLLLNSVDIWNIIIKDPQHKREELRAQAKLEPFHDWQKEHGDHFPIYIKTRCSCYSRSAILKQLGL